MNKPPKTTHTVVGKRSAKRPSRAKMSLVVRRARREKRAFVEMMATFAPPAPDPALANEARAILAAGDAKELAELRGLFAVLRADGVIRYERTADSIKVELAPLGRDAPRSPDAKKTVEPKTNAMDLAMSLADKSQENSYGVD